MSLKALRQKRTTLAAESQAIFDKAAADGNRSLSAEEKARDDAIGEQLVAIDDDIARATRNLERQRNLPSADDDNVAVAEAAARQAAAEPRFKGFGEQLIAVYNADASGGARVDPRLVAAASGASEGSPSDGGFMVQTDIADALIDRTYELGDILKRIRKIPISEGANSLVMNGIDESSRANGSRWGGVRAYWAAEAGTVAASAPKFRQIKLDLKKLMLINYQTDELISDARAVGFITEQAVAEEFVFKLEDSAIRGEGGGLPLGILNSPAKIAVAKETGQPAATLVIENIVKMWARMWGRSRRDAVWLINQDIEPQLYTMGQVVGTGGIPVYLPPGGLSQSPFGTLLGRPVIPCEYCNTLGTEGDIILADWSQYLAIDKSGLKRDVSIHVRFIYGEQTFRFTYRYDGQPLWQTALTPYKGSNTLSPFITLATRA